VIRSLLYELRSELKYVPEEPVLDVSLRSSTRSRPVVEAGIRGRGGRVGRIVEAKASGSGIGDLPVDLVGGSIPQTSVYSLAHARTCGCSLIPNLLSAKMIATSRTLFFDRLPSLVPITMRRSRAHSRQLLTTALDPRGFA